MPESPDVQDQEVSVSFPEVPLREGEDRFRAGMNLEDARRRESVVADLQRQIRELAGTSAGEVQSRFARSPSARKRQQLVLHKTQELKNLTTRHGDTWDGPCAPATVINLNPVKLTLYGQLQRLSIPPAGKGALVKLAFRGRTFTGSYVTITAPEVWLACMGVTPDPMGDTPTMEAKYIPPLGLAHQFYSHYCEGAPDAQHMGGILAFEGDLHILNRPRPDGSKRSVRMPKATFSNDGTGEVMYSAEPLLLEEYLRRELAQQQAYAEAIIAEGHRYANSQSDDVRNQLSNIHILWHNFALDCGYIQKPYPWASSKLQDSPLIQAVFCPDCRAKQEDPEQYFCRNCNAPFDAYKAFMAGRQVSPDRLAVYDEKSKEWADIVAEMTQRRNRMVLLGGEETKTEPKRRKEPTQGA